MDTQKKTMSRFTPQCIRTMVNGRLLYLIMYLVLSEIVKTKFQIESTIYAEFILIELMSYDL